MSAPKSKERRDLRHECTDTSAPPRGREAPAQLSPRKGKSAPPSPRTAPIEPSSSSPSGRRPSKLNPDILVLALALGSFAAMVGLMWLTFGRTVEGAFVMLIATLVYAAFIVVPLILLRLARREPAGGAASLRDYLHRTMDTRTGPLESRAALVQIVAVPVLLTLCVAGIDVALSMAR